MYGGHDGASTADPDDDDDIKRQPSTCRDMSFTFEMLNMMQVPRNYQGLINHLPIHLMHAQADLYKEVHKSGYILFEPIEEFITLKNLNKTTTTEDPRIASALSLETQDANILIEPVSTDITTPPCQSPLPERPIDMLDQLYKRFNVPQNLDLMFNPDFKLIPVSAAARVAKFGNPKFATTPQL